MKHLKLFESITEYENYINSESVILPNISFVVETNKILYNPVKKNYMRFVAIEDSSILLSSYNIETGGPDDTLDLLYSKDGTLWTLYEFTAIPLSAGETLYMKGNNPNGLSTTKRVCSFGDLSFEGIGNGNCTSGKYECHGNIMSLLYSDNFEDKTTIPISNCFVGFFMMCDGLLTAPELPATTLTERCYVLMFRGCTSLTTMPELPATTLAAYCYRNMFIDCSSLTTMLELPATTLAEYCYQHMFYKCSSLTAASELPATNLASYCYNEMFLECTSLTTAPTLLPATILADHCYSNMFARCTSLINAPALPATTLADHCYSNMFNGTNILPDCANIDFTNEKVIASGGLIGLFSGTKVTDADLEQLLPKNNEGKYCLPVTTLVENCYYRMFADCTSLTTAPELPATTLAKSCYRNMFRNCTSLVTAPELPATTLAEDCYNSMFNRCSKLNYIKMLATDISATGCLFAWVESVASTGTFVKHPNMTSLPKGWSGIPSNWTVIDY